MTVGDLLAEVQLGIPVVALGGRRDVDVANWPVNAPITNVHISNEGSNNSNNTIVGDNNVIMNANIGITINA